MAKKTPQPSYHVETDVVTQAFVDSPDIAKPHGDFYVVVPHSPTLSSVFYSLAYADPRHGPRFTLHSNRTAKNIPRA